MPRNIAPIGEAIAAGIRTDFDMTYREEYEGLIAELGPVMELAVNSTRREEDYFYRESAPYPKRTPRGESPVSDPFKGVKYTIENLIWTNMIEWDRDDVADDQTNTLERRARESGENWATLPERVFFQMITGGVDPELLEFIPQAPDGAVIYSATDGSGAARFGVTGGNTFAGAGVTLESQIQTDYWKMVALWRRYLNTKSQPLLSRRAADRGVTIFYNATNEEVFRRAFGADLTLRTQTVAATGTAAHTDNVILKSGQKVKLVSTNRITDNQWYAFLDNPRVKPVFEQERDPLEDRVITIENSTEAKKTNIEALIQRARRGYGTNLPFATIRSVN